MGNVDNGGLQSLVKLGNLNTHLSSQLCIQVGQRLVHQEYLGAADNGASHGNTLSLAAGKSLWLTVQQMLQVENLGCVMHFLVNLILWCFSQLQSERHVVIYGHMWIQSIVLEYHGDISVLWFNVINQLIVDVKLTG